MFITVTANNGTHGALHRAGRKFSNGTKVRFEVVADVPTKVKKRNEKTGALEEVRGPADPHAPFVHGKDADGLPTQTPSMTQICESGVKQLRGDARISISEGDEMQVTQTAAAVADLREQLATAQEELSNARVDLAERDAALKVASARIAELEQSIKLAPKGDGEDQAAGGKGKKKD